MTAILPSWLPDAVGAISSLLLTVPAWRAASLLKAIFIIERKADQHPRSRSGHATERKSRTLPHREAASRLATAMRGPLGKWNQLDDIMLKLGLGLLPLSFVARLFT